MQDVMVMKGTEDEYGSILSMGNKSDSSETETSIIMQGLNSRGGGPNLHHNIPPSHPQPSSTIRSPTPTAIQFKFNATNQTLASDFDRLLENKNYYRDPLDDNKSILSKECLRQGNDKEPNKDKAEVIGCSEFDDDDNDKGFSPSDCGNATGYKFCQLECSFPDMFEDVNETLSNDLHNLKLSQERERQGMR
ncbi:hypothetical protein QTG54_006286 [Skeletonema marinoi]|uniref:Uncharacterized protein n=1 Tax=Skeletonema marinoi TaxID=267567 RepID=A0AAD8YA92_9STRA|nr:hypothetical protein QTG54_006286 [Skeletonema marinoi]